MCAHVHDHAPRGDVHVYDHGLHGDVHVYDHDLHDDVHAYAMAHQHFFLLLHLRLLPYAFP